MEHYLDYDVLECGEFFLSGAGGGKRYGIYSCRVAPLELVEIQQKMRRYCKNSGSGKGEVREISYACRVVRGGEQEGTQQFGI